MCDYSRPVFEVVRGWQTNLCHNAVDRHAAKRPNDRALIYISTETDEEGLSSPSCSVKSNAWRRSTRALASSAATACSSICR